jgi:epoxide hydrolase-like predicted phosphatase
MPIKAVIFDLGGVLVHTVDRRAQRRWEVCLGVAEGDLPRLVVETASSMEAVKGKISEEAAWRIVGKNLGLNSGQLEQFRQDYFAGDRIDPCLTRFLCNLRPSYKTAILTNAWLGARELFDPKYKLSRLVSTVIYSAEERMAKPDLRIYRLCAERLAVRCSEAVFIDDKEENVRAARRAGMHGLNFESGSQIIAELRLLLNACVT